MLSICVFRNVFLATIKSDWLQFFRQNSHFGYNFHLARGTPGNTVCTVLCVACDLCVLYVVVSSTIESLCLCVCVCAGE